MVTIGCNIYQFGVLVDLVPIVTRMEYVTYSCDFLIEISEGSRDFGCGCTDIIIIIGSIKFLVSFQNLLDA
jgi:hypothetical protein